VFGFAQSKEVRGSSETALEEPVARVDGAPVPLEPAHEETEVAQEAGASAAIATL
jgi:hypothetical protein